MSGHEIYLDSATYFFQGWISFEVFEEIFRLSEENIPLADLRWQEPLGEYRTAQQQVVQAALRLFPDAAAMFEAISRGEVRMSEGPLHAENQRVLAREFLKLNREKN
jgi:hypothetical protein